MLEGNPFVQLQLHACLNKKVSVTNNDNTITFQASKNKDKQNVTFFFCKQQAE